MLIAMPYLPVLFPGLALRPSLYVQWCAVRQYVCRIVIGTHFNFNGTAPNHANSAVGRFTTPLHPLHSWVIDKRGLARPSSTDHPAGTGRRRQYPARFTVSNPFLEAGPMFAFDCRGARHCNI